MVLVFGYKKEKHNSAVYVLFTLKSGVNHKVVQLFRFFGSTTGVNYARPLIFRSRLERKEGPKLVDIVSEGAFLFLFTCISTKYILYSRIVSQTQQKEQRALHVYSTANSVASLLMTPKILQSLIY